MSEADVNIQGSDRDSELHCLHLTVKCLSGEKIPFVLDYTDELLSRALFCKVEQITGIPQDLQMLFYKTHLLNPVTPLRVYCLEDGCSIDLSVKGVGGGGETDSEGN